MKPHERGFALEGLLRDLFDTFDLDPKASFRVTGEQIDGGFTLDNIHFVLEAKWENAPADRAALDTFNSKVERRSDITQGLFVAIGGFVPTAVDLHSRRRSPLILMDGGDLFPCSTPGSTSATSSGGNLRHAAMTGDILHTATEILGGS